MGRLAGPAVGSLIESLQRLPGQAGSSDSLASRTYVASATWWQQKSTVRLGRRTTIGSAFSSIRFVAIQVVTAVPFSPLRTWYPWARHRR
jgi:hypothetical protein